MKCKNYNLQEQRQALLEIIPDLEEGDNKNKLRDLAHWIDRNSDNERARKVMIYVYLDLNDGGRLYFTTSPQVYMHSEDMRYQYSFEHEVRPEDYNSLLVVRSAEAYPPEYDADRAFITRSNDNEKSN